MLRQLGRSLVQRAGNGSSHTFRTGGCRGKATFTQSQHSLLKKKPSSSLFNNLPRRGNASVLRSIASTPLLASPFLVYSALESNRKGNQFKPLPIPQTVVPKSEPGIITKCLNFIRTCLRTIGMGFIGISLATSGLLLHYIPFIPEFPKRWWRGLLVYCLGHCGACPSKLGQWAATRPDLFSEEICLSLSDLHTRVPTHSWHHTQKMLSELYGDELEGLFKELDKEPIASGCVAQVYRATLMDMTLKVPQPVQVILKVRHPHVVRNIETDLTILRCFASLSEWIPGFKWMSVRENLESFALQMESQVDLTVEGENLLLFRENFKKYPNICFPRPFLEISNEQILVETYEEGTRVSEYFDRNASGVNSSEEFKEKLASLGFNAFLKMLFIDNLIHGDLHPGNVLVREKSGENQKPQIVFLDAGLIIRLSEGDRSNFMDLFSAVAAGNGKRGAQLMIERSKSQIPCEELQEKFKVEMRDLFEDVTSKPLGEIPMGREFFKVMRLCRSCQVQIDGNFCSLITGLVVVEGLSRALNAKFDLIGESRPLLAKDREFVTNYLRNRL